MQNTTITAQDGTHYGVSDNYEYNDGTRKRHYIQVWSGPFYSVWEAEGYSLPKRNGYMLTTYNGDKVRVLCPLRVEETYREVDAAIAAALSAHYASQGSAVAGSGVTVYLCADCSMYVTNAETPVTDDGEIDPDWAARVKAHGPAAQGHYALGSDTEDLDFDAVACDYCGSTLAGFRYNYTRFSA